MSLEGNVRQGWLFYLPSQNGVLSSGPICTCFLEASQELSTRSQTLSAAARPALNARPRILQSICPLQPFHLVMYRIVAPSVHEANISPILQDHSQPNTKDSSHTKYIWQYMRIRNGMIKCLNMLGRPVEPSSRISLGKLSTINFVLGTHLIFWHLDALANVSSSPLMKDPMFKGMGNDLEIYLFIEERTLTVT